MSQAKFDSVHTEHRLRGSVQERLTVADLQAVPVWHLLNNGFGNWDGDLMLMPPWAVEILQTGQVITCIDGSTARVGLDSIDLDTRGGCIAHGFNHAGLKDLKP